MARLAKFSDAMSSMDVNCVLRDAVAAMAWKLGRRRPRAVAPLSVDGVARRGDASLDTARAAPSLDKRRFRTRRACLAPLLLGDELRHLAVDLLEGLKPRVGFDHRSHGAASVEYEAVRSAYERYSYERPRSNG